MNIGKNNIDRETKFSYIIPKSYTGKPIMIPVEETSKFNRDNITTYNNRGEKEYVKC